MFQKELLNGAPMKHFFRNTFIIGFLVNICSEESNDILIFQEEFVTFPSVLS